MRVYGLWARGDGYGWVGGGRCFLSQENLTILTVVRLPNMRVPLGIKK